jgi:hypothetical protein
LDGQAEQVMLSFNAGLCIAKTIKCRVDSRVVGYSEVGLTAYELASQSTICP